ncbi:MAG TPA: alpha/beta hydrolase-fold protein [Solirubrobacteraceae bacterium]|nr:alpha/beta hydrolase-fold protein [Solirubrobacteraceae bacterium]
MRSLVARLCVVLAAAAVWTAGAVGAYSYGRDYNLHRGFATLVQLPRAGTGRLLDVRFYSPALRRMAGYTVYLPPGYSPARRYPVYYLLHGMPGQPHVFVTIANMDVRLDNQLSLGTLQPMILVYPDGRIGGRILSDSEWANTPAGGYESYVLDVVRNVDQRFSTLPYRQDRVIGGFSAGAYGAINIALHHLAIFGSVQVWSGYFTQSPTGVFAHSSRAVLRYNSPLDYVRTVGPELAARGLRVFMFVGRDDSSSVQLLPMVDALRTWGATVQYAIYPGGHDWSVWYPRLNQMLILASRDMGTVPTHPALAAGRRHAARRHAARRPTPRPVRASHRAQMARFPGDGGHRRPIPRVPLPVFGALLLALASAALINLGFVLQHHGLVRSAREGHGPVGGALRSPAWLAGQAIGWVGFAGQIAAVALAPLTLVQAFAAGGLALSVPVIARAFGHRVGRRQLAAVVAVAASLFVLPIGFTARHTHIHNGLFVAASLLTLAIAGLAARVDRGAARAIAAGGFYGLADAAIKAGALSLHGHGPAALLSGTTILAAGATFAGFLSFQSALRRGPAVGAITLMNAFTALTAVGFGLAAFGETLGTGALASVVHAVAIGLVLVCVWPLAARQEQLVGAEEPTRDGGSAGDRTRALGAIGVARFLLRAAGGVFSALVVILSCAVGIGLLYALRTRGWLAAGPRVPDSLPLLQLAGFDGQPLARVAAAWLLTGAALGVVLVRLRPSSRALLVAVVGGGTLLLASDASLALARNLRFDQVLAARAPALGPWLAGLLLVIGCVLPGRPLRLALRAIPRPPRRALVLRPAARKAIAQTTGTP